MIANQAVEDYCFSKILMYVPDLKSDTDRLSDAIELLRDHRYRILNNQSLEASKSMGINWIAGHDPSIYISYTSSIDHYLVQRFEVLVLTNIFLARKFEGGGCITFKI